MSAHYCITCPKCQSGCPMCNGCKCPSVKPEPPMFAFNCGCERVFTDTGAWIANAKCLYLQVVAERDRLLADLQRCREALEQYGEHERDCILARCQAGEPTPDGGYRRMFKDKWYQCRPVDETPKCECGLDAVLKALP